MIVILIKLINHIIILLKYHKYYSKYPNVREAVREAEQNAEVFTSIHILNKHK